MIRKVLALSLAVGMAASANGLIQAQPPAATERTPEQGLATLTAPADLEVTIFAAEPVLANPTSIDIDHRGRVWVCEVINYRHFRNTDVPEREAGDRILILEDTDGDAKADKTTVYYQGRDIDSAHGICVLGDRVIVSAGDRIFSFTDTDGDDRADRKEVLFSGIGGAQHDHGIHAMNFGPDGRLYFNFGNEGHQLKDKDGKIVVDLAGNEVKDSGKPYRQGMVFRCDPDGSHVETLGWNFRNNWEVFPDSFGTLWQSDNDDDGNKAVRINAVVEYGNYGYTDELTGEGWRTARTGMSDLVPERHWHLNDPGVMPTPLVTGAGAPTGITVYEGDLLPERFRGQAIHCDAGPNVVRCYPAETAGAGYELSIAEIINGQKDQWFRPSDVCVAPDGSLLVADWYDPGVGGHRMQDVERGRIFRITPNGQAREYRVPKFDLTTPEAAVDALKSPNAATRALAFMKLAEDQSAGPALKKLWNDSNPRFQARALWLLARKEGLDGPAMREAVESGNADLRITALRAARMLTRGDRTALLPILDKASRDNSPQIRREAAVALRECDGDQVSRIWAALAMQHDGQDRWYLEALGLAADGRWDDLLSDWLKVVGSEGLRSPAGRDIIWRSRSKKTPELLAGIVTSRSVPESELPRYLRAFDFQRLDVAQPVLEKLAFAPIASGDTRQQWIALEAISRLKDFKLADHPQHRQTLDRILDAARGTAKFVELVDRFELSEREAELATLAAEHASDEVGVAAIRSLLDRDRRKLLLSVLKGENDELAAGLIKALGNSANGRAAGVLLPIATDESMDLNRRRLAIAALPKTKPGAERLIELAREKKLDVNLQQAAAAALHASITPAISATVNELFPLPQMKGSTSLPSIAVLATRRGDVSRGKQVYLEAGTCAKCHQVMGIGQNIGPNLSEIGSKLSREAMYESILFPSAGISHNYESYAALLADGNIVTGLLVSQTDEELTLKGADAIARTFKRDEVEELIKQEISLMPADLQKLISEQDLVDVVEFLMTLKKPE